MFEKIIVDGINKSIEIKEGILKDYILVKKMCLVVKAIINAYKSAKKVILFGNGGSAADAQHIAGELVNRFYFDRKSLPAMALRANTSVLTAIGNDYFFDKIFSK